MHMVNKKYIIKHKRAVIVLGVLESIGWSISVILTIIGLFYGVVEAGWLVFCLALGIPRVAFTMKFDGFRNPEASPSSLSE